MREDTRGLIHPGDGDWNERLRAKRARRTRQGWVRGGMLLLALLAALGTGWFFRETPPLRGLWSVGQITVRGNRTLPREELLTSLGLREGMAWWRVPFGRELELIRSEPLLSELSLHGRWPLRCEVWVAERSGFARILDPSTASWFEIARDGTILPAPRSEAAEDVPWLTGALSGPFELGTRLELDGREQTFEQLVRLEHDWPELWRDVSELRYVGKRGFEVYLRSGRFVVLWDPSLNHDLWGQVPKLLTELERLEIDDAVLNMRYRDQVVVRPAKGQMPVQAEGAEDENRDAEGNPEERALPGATARNARRPT